MTLNFADRPGIFEPTVANSYVPACHHPRPHLNSTTDPTMKIIREPSVYLVGRQITDDAEIDRFLADHDVSGWSTDATVAGEKLCEIAGRVCYMSFAKPRPGGNSAYLDRIIGVRHGSVLEHCVFNFIITGVSRSKPPKHAPKWKNSVSSHSKPTSP